MTLADVEQRTAAAGLRLPRSTIHDIESGRSSVPRSRLRHRAETLAAWWLLEKAALREGNYEAALR